MRLIGPMAVLAAALALAACGGEVQIQAPQANAPDLVSNTPVAASFTATGRWRLVSATLDGRDLTGSFMPQAGAQGEVSNAGLSMPAGPHSLQIVADVGPQTSPFGLNRSTKAVAFSVASPSVTLEVPHFSPADSPELYDSDTRLTLKVIPNFDWRELRALRTTTGRTGSTSETSSFSPRSGLRGQASTAAVTLGGGAHRLLIGVKDPAGTEFTAEGIVRVASGAPPLCNVSLNCLQPGGANHVAVGSRLPPWCGGGTWAFKDATRDRCQAVGGAANTTGEQNRTVCDVGVRRFLSGVATCVSGTSFLGNPPGAEFAAPPAPPACMVDHACDGSTISCGVNQYRQHSIGGGCFCADCP